MDAFGKRVVDVRDRKAPVAMSHVEACLDCTYLPIVPKERFGGERGDVTYKEGGKRAYVLSEDENGAFITFSNGSFADVRRRLKKFNLEFK